MYNGYIAQKLQQGKVNELYQPSAHKRAVVEIINEFKAERQRRARRLIRR